MVFVMWVACVALAVNSTSQPVGSNTDTVEQLRSFKAGGGRDRLAKLLNELRADPPAGRSPEWSQLWSIVREPSALPAVRVGIMTVLLDKSDAQSAGLMIKELGAVGQEVEDALRHGTGDTGAESGGLLLSVFATRIGAEPWRSWLAASPDGPNLLRLLAGSVGGLESRSLALQALVESPMPPHQRREVAEQLVLGEQAGGEIGPAMALLTEESFPLLRQAVLQSAGDWTTLHWGAAKALAHLGDSDILPQFRLIRDQFLHSVPPASSPQAGRRLAANMDYLIKQIEMQHPPSGLTRYIASNEGVDPPSQLRLWAVNRALEVGVDSKDIRQAILTHTSVVHEMLRRGELPARKELSLVELKAVGRASGVLLPADLSDVRDLPDR